MRWCISAISLGVMLARALSAASCSFSQWPTSSSYAAPIEYVATCVPSSTSRFRSLANVVSYQKGRRRGQRHRTGTSGIVVYPQQFRTQAEYAESRFCEEQKCYQRHRQPLLADLRIALAPSWAQVAWIRVLVLTEAYVVDVMQRSCRWVQPTLLPFGLRRSRVWA